MKIVPLGNVTFQRNVSSEFPNFIKSEKLFSKIDIYEKGTIEDSKDSLHADFANKFIGGACISYGCVQEEILFAENPECICSRLFTYILLDNESMIIKGAEKYSNHLNYSHNLDFGGNFDDENVDENGFNKNQIVVMDALIFSGIEDYQWDKNKIDRELNKGYVSFYKNELKNISSILIEFY